MVTCKSLWKLLLKSCYITRITSVPIPETSSHFFSNITASAFVDIILLIGSKKYLKWFKMCVPIIFQNHAKCFNACVVPALVTCIVLCFIRGLGLNKRFAFFFHCSSASFYWCPLRTIHLFLHLVAPFLVTFSKFQTYFHMRLGNLKFQELGKIKLVLAEVAADGKMP